MTGATGGGNDAAIAVFARRPVPGRVKTRLAATVGVAEACRIYERLLAHTLRAVASVGGADRFVYLAEAEALDRPDLAPGGFTYRRQRGGDLGDRMANAFAELLARYVRVVLVGSDCAGLTGALLQEALAALAEPGTEVVVGPARDGGYYLVGQSGRPRDLFGGIPWSTSEVWPRTRARLAAGGWCYRLLRELEDVDDAAAWERVRGLIA